MLHVRYLHHKKVPAELYKSHTKGDPITPLLPVETGSSKENKYSRASF